MRLLTDLRLPAWLSAQCYALRSEQEEDLPFLRALYATLRAPEFAGVTWSTAQLNAFVAQQFAAQRHHYRSTLVGCAFAIIEHRGVPIGRLYLQDLETRLHIVDIALLPQARGGGVGTALLDAVIADAQTRGKGVGIFVERNNPALRLYERLGFAQLGKTEFYFEMERPASAPIAAPLAAPIPVS